jgi:hypothetical protein
MERLRCVHKFYDEKSDCIWAWFAVHEDGIVDEHMTFKMPVNNDDFSIGEDYRITWKHLLKMD